MEISQSELDFLAMVTDIINKKITDTENANKKLLESLKENMSYMWDSIYEMDSAERAFVKNQMSMLDTTQQQNIKELVSYRASLKSPYFGGIDFVRDDSDEFLSYRIGLKGIKIDTNVYVVDWRAPFSELYYNFDVGEGYFITDGNKVTGDIKKKRQYKIENGKMVFALESDIKIDDNILQEVLAKTSSEKMKNIVSTIQKEQNAIIRKETQNNIIVQGVAGSGKTSIALHRIAYLLYKHRKTLNSNSILILSPNKFFSDYISNVLPELGEENIAETTLDQILKEELNLEQKIETKTEQVERLLNDEFEVKLSSVKNSMGFCKNIQEFCKDYFEKAFIPQDFVYNNFCIVKKEILQEKFFISYKDRPVFMKLEWLKDFIRDEGIIEYELKIPRSEINKQLNKMMQKSDIFTVYNEFLKQKYNSSFALQNTIKFEDAVALLYIKQYLYGYTCFNKIQHLLIDEFQDYNPLTYHILSKMFPCMKTILGDISQNISGSQSDLLKNLKELDTSRDNELISLNKSYRSTYEITNFSNKIIGRENVEIVNRHGEPIQIAKYNSLDQKLNFITSTVKKLLEKGYKSVAILTKSIKQSSELNEVLKDKLKYFYLSPESNQFDEGVILSSTFLVKGLEFDAVILIDTDSENFATEIDKQALYVASSRAMHELKILFANNLTKFIKL